MVLVPYDGAVQLVGFVSRIGTERGYGPLSGRGDSHYRVPRLVADGVWHEIAPVPWVSENSSETDEVCLGDPQLDMARRRHDWPQFFRR